MNLREALQRKRLIVCAGSGGVGKTSVSAALGLEAARLGRKALVMTVDPARRLATALNMKLEDNAETRIAPEAIDAAGLHVAGEFWAMMLNAKRTFDAIVDRYAPDDGVKRTIFDNSAYKHGSTALIESPEYMAMEKVHELYHERDYDLIIVDTPPLKHALDFLTAPKRFKGMLTGNPMIRMLVAAVGESGGGRRPLWLRLGRAGIFRAVALVTGEKAVQDAAEFFSAAHNLMGGFEARADEVDRIFRSDACAMFVVTSPNLITIEEALFLKARAEGFGMHLGGFVVNRVEPDYLKEISGRRWLPPAEEVPAKARAAGVPAELLEVLLENLRQHEVRRATDQKNIALLEREIATSQFVARVPELPTDVADLKGLARIGEFLYEAP